jgi:acetyl esterase/lipase
MFLANSMSELVPPEEIQIAATALMKAGVPVRTVLLEGSRHAEGYIEDVFDDSMRFLAHYLNLPTGG